MSTEKKWLTIGEVSAETLRTLRSAVYSQTVARLKQAIAQMNHEDVVHARKIAQETAQYLDKMNQKQLRGMHYLYTLCRSLHLIE